MTTEGVVTVVARGVEDPRDLEGTAEQDPAMSKVSVAQAENFLLELLQKTSPPTYVTCIERGSVARVVVRREFIEYDFRGDMLDPLIEAAMLHV